MANKKRNEGQANEHGGDFDVAPYDATEPERIHELERRASPPRDEDEFVTDAELEARELDFGSDED
jgi:hypothetical protein